MNTHVLVENDRRPQIYHAIGEVYREMHVDAAQNIRGMLHASLQSGVLNPDTGALGESLYVQTQDESDYDERYDAAKDAYLSAASFWRDVVRDVLNPDAYSEDHFQNRVLPMEALPEDAIVAVATFMAYGWWWQMGHFNLLTEQWDQRSWFIEPIARWAQESMTAVFNDFEARVIAKVGS